MAEYSRFEPPPGTPDIDAPQAVQVERFRSTSSRQAGHIRTGARMPRSVISHEAIFASRDIFQRVFLHSQAGLLSPIRLSSPTQRSNPSRRILARRRIRGVYTRSKSGAVRSLATTLF